ncbi:MAG: Uma2 family endonuclease, partial [Anaerolineae bacterium]|nr:Uma2 family endonuclease [Anaerolineae bacterium]
MVAVPREEDKQETRRPPLSQYDMTYHDIAALPDFITCYEIWEGELVMNPAPSINHQEISAKLMLAFGAHDPERSRGRYFHAPIDVVLREDITVQPDIVYVSRKRDDIIKGQHILGAPDLCIEILSPRTVDDDLNRKRRYYRENGVREYWIVNPFAHTVT